MAHTEMAPTTRVPAWKRLGLKLTHQDESKKRKIEQVSPNPQTQNTIKRKKSVTFAQDVKADDGSHTEKIVNDFIEEQRGGPEEFTPHEVRQFSTTSTHPANGGSSKNVKSETRKATTKPETTPELKPAQQSEYLRYLIQFATDKANWKFKKHDQTLLLKYTFSERRIPSEYFGYYLKYIEGLQGQARQRLAERARAVIDEPDIEAERSEDESGPKDTESKKKKDTKKQVGEMENLDTRKEARDMAMKKQLLDTKIRLREADDDAALGSEEFRMKFTKRKRGEEILKLLADVSATLGMPVKDEAYEDIAPTNQVINPRSLTNPGRRNRLRIKKARTGLPEDDLSSVSSVELDSESEGVAKRSKRVETKANNGGSSESSDSTSDSDSSSSEDSDSDSESSSDDSSDPEAEVDHGDQLFFQS